MITTGNFPESFKMSKIVPLFKKGAPSLLTNFRPISLLPTISKIFERIIHDQLYEYLNDNNLLAEQQFDFRKLHSTEYAAVNLIDHVAKQIESGHIPCNLYNDLSKVVDTLSHDILLNKLKYNGFVGTELKSLTSYMLNRKQYVKYKAINLISLISLQEFPKVQSLGHYYLVYILMIWSVQVTC